MSVLDETYQEVKGTELQAERAEGATPNTLPQYLNNHCMAGKYEYRNYCHKTGVWRPMQGDFMIEMSHGPVFGMPSVFNKELDPFPCLQQVTMESGDFLLVTGQKTGTHLVNEIMMMLMNGSAEYVQENKCKYWIDIQSYDTILESTTAPRVLNTHMGLSWIPPNFRRSDTKVIFTLRNFKDTFVSYFNHLRAHVPELRAERPDAEAVRKEWNKYFIWLSRNEYKNWGNFWDRTADAWDNHRDDPNVLFVHFEQVKKDPEAEIVRIAEHMGVSHTPELVSQIASALDIDKMRKGKYESEALWRKVTGFDQFTLFRKGQAGDWKNWFTEEQNEEFDRKFEEWNKERQIPFIFE